MFQIGVLFLFFWAASGQYFNRSRSVIRTISKQVYPVLEQRGISANINELELCMQSRVRSRFALLGNFGLAIAYFVYCDFPWFMAAVWAIAVHTIFGILFRLALPDGVLIGGIQKTVHSNKRKHGHEPCGNGQLAVADCCDAIIDAMNRL